MKILVVVAMPNEMKPIREWIKSTNLKAKLDIDFLCCGMWNYEAISSLQQYLMQHPEPMFIRNIWMCGYRNLDNEKKSEPIQVSNVINIHTEKESIIPPFLQIVPMRTCFSGETLTYKKPQFKKEIWTINGEMYFDMECRWIEFVVTKFKFPRLYLKIPFDFVWIETEWCIKERAITDIPILLESLPYYDYLSKILNWINMQK